MGKTRAEIQKAYRDRLKEKNKEQYLHKERERRRRNYVPSAELTKSQRDERNRKNRATLRRFYQRQTENRRRNTKETSGYDSGPIDTENNQLRVRLEFPNRRAGALKRWKRELFAANSRIKHLENERDTILRKFRSTQRAIQRMKAKPTDKAQQHSTPKKQTETLMNEARLSDKQKLKIRKSLLLGNVIASEIKASRKRTPKKVKAIHNIVSGNIIKKYRCGLLLSKKTGLCRHRLTKSKHEQDGKQSRFCKIQKHRDMVVQFMEREDNSRIQPGKNDAKKVGKGKGNSKQIHVLTDYLSNLYQKFKAENPNADLSFTSFTRARPKHVLLTSFISRHTCLCTRHQNAAMTVKSLRTAGTSLPSNPESVLDQKPSLDTIRESIGENVILSQWKRIEVEEKGKKKYVTKIVQTTLTRDEMVTHFDNQMKDFEQHVQRVKTQYHQIRHLKENLPPHQIILQMDFAENYSCKSLEEVQSAYFNQTSVTLHPVVAYFKDPRGSLQHKSYIIVSDEMAHKSSTVLAFINAIMPDLKSIDSNLDTIHYWTDSPSSQYRNKHVFDFVANHTEAHGIKARWNYFESGHGKGSCDGLGGTCKRLADQAIRSGKVLIQDARGFYEWAVDSSMTHVTFRYVPSTKCAEAEECAKQRELKVVRNTMKVHPTVGLGQSQIKVRDVSCYCETCLLGKLCDTWRQEATRNTTPPNVLPETGPELQPSCKQQSDPSSVTVVFEVGQFVSATYDSKWYIGQIVDIDEDDSEVEITFMEKRKQFYQWPSRPDKIWLKTSDILCVLDNLIATGKSKRMYKLTDNDVNLVAALFAEKLV